MTETKETKKLQELKLKRDKELNDLRDYKKLNEKKKRPKIKTINPNMEYVPSKYPTEVNSYLVIHSKGKKSTEIKVKEKSSEIIVLPDKTEVITGVEPEQLHTRTRWGWKIKRVHHKMFGIPFTYCVTTGDIFSNEKKRNILIERNIGYPINIGDKKIVILLDYTKDVPTPLWRKEWVDNDEDEEEWVDSGADIQKKRPKTELKTIKELDNWLRAKNIKGELDELEYFELPVYTEYDVTDIDIMKSETFQLVENKVIETAIIAMSKVGEDRSMLWYFAIFGTTLFLIVLVFLFYANEGAMTKMPGLILNA